MNKVIKQSKSSVIYHESDVEIESGSLETGYKDSSIPENKSNNPKRLSLRESEQKIRPKGRPVRFIERFLQAFAIQSKAVPFSSQGSDGTDGTRCFAGQLCGFCMCLLVGLILQNDDLL
jgi:hypothetical protein